MTIEQEIKRIRLSFAMNLILNFILLFLAYLSMIGSMTTTAMYGPLLFFLFMLWYSKSDLEYATRKYNKYVRKRRL